MRISANLPPATRDMENSARNLLQHDQQSAETAEAFEALFGTLLVKEMRRTLSDGFFGSDSSDVYGGLFDQYIGEQLAAGEGLGIKRFIMARADGAKKEP